eukprot:1435809-Pyramimonas_sp.AAC.1
MLFAAPAQALISAFFMESGRVSSGRRSAVSSPRRLSPFGRKAKSESFRSRGIESPEQRKQARSSRIPSEWSRAVQALYGRQSGPGAEGE